MAGVLLFNAISEKGLKNFDHKIKALEKCLTDQFNGSPYFTAKYLRPNPHTCLFLFQKHKQNKYYFDAAGNWLAYEGRVFALRESLCYSAKDLWRLYRRYGSRFPDYLDGHFVIKLYDQQTDELWIVTDFIKSKANYLCQTEHFVMITPFLLPTAIIQKPEIDWHAFNEFLWRYYILSYRTILKNTKRLAPATIYRIKRNKIRTQKYWHWPHEYTDFPLQSCIRRISHNIQESAHLISENLGRPLIEFTMGQDSRQILSGFTSQKLNFTTAIYGRPSFLEVARVKEMAHRHHFENHHIQLGADITNNPWHFYKQGIIWGNCEEPGYLIGRILYMRLQYLALTSLVLNGVHGRFYKDGLWNELYVFNLYREPKEFNIDLFLKYRAMNKNYPDHIFTKPFQTLKQHSRDYFHDMVTSSIQGYQESPVAIQVDKFDMQHYANFGLVSNNICSLTMDLISPLLLRRNMELAITVPVKWKYNLSHLQRGVVSLLDPSLAKEKTDMCGINMTPKTDINYLFHLARYYACQAQKLQDKFKRLMGKSPLNQLQKAWNYLPLYQKVFQNEEFQQLMQFDRMELSALLDKSEWNRFLKQYTQKDFQTVDRYEFLYKLASIEYFLIQAKRLWRKQN